MIWVSFTMNGMSREKTMKLYEIYQGEQLKIAELILQRRLQMLVHSYIYYELNDNIISDSTWSKWAVELADLQNKYPEIAKTVEWAEAFKDWDGSTGAFLPLQNEWVITKAYQLTGRVLPNISKSETPKINKKSKNKSKKLF